MNYVDILNFIVLLCEGTTLSTKAIDKVLWVYGV